jgi:hypothetical protein
MDKKELEITISPDGEVRVLVKCVKGQRCVDETKFLEEALGGEVKARELTPEYYEQPAAGAQVQVKPGSK